MPLMSDLSPEPVLVIVRQIGKRVEVHGMLRSEGASVKHIVLLIKSKFLTKLDYVQAQLLLGDACKRVDDPT